MQRSRAREAFLDHAVQIDAAQVQLATAGGSDAAGAQHLFDGGQQPVAVLHHGAVELLALGFVDGAGLQRFQVQPDGRDRSLQLVRDGVDEGVVLFVAPDLADQKRGVQHHADDDDQSQQQEPRNSRMPVCQCSSTQPI